MALSPLDKVAARFFRSLRSIESFWGGAGGDAEAPAWSVFNGNDMERWTLKALLGMLASKSISHLGSVMLGGTRAEDPLEARSGAHLAARNEP